MHVGELFTNDNYNDNDNNNDRQFMITLALWHSTNEPKNLFPMQLECTKLQSITQAPVKIFPFLVGKESICNRMDWVHPNTTGNIRFFLYLNTKQILLFACQICCLYSPKFIHSHQCSYSYTKLQFI